MKGYKFIQKDMTSKNGDEKWKLGEWKKFDGELVICSSGFHASPTPLDSLEYIYGDRWVVIEAGGPILKDKDKFCSSEMRLVKEIPVKKVLCWFAIACARRCLKYWDKKHPNDKRPLEAIEAAENYLKKPTKLNLEKLVVAKSAAWSAWSAERKWQNKILVILIKGAKK